MEVAVIKGLSREWGKMGWEWEPGGFNGGARRSIVRSRVRMALALYPRNELATDAKIAPEGYGFSGISLAYNTRNREEVDSVLAEAQAAGAKLLKPAEDAFWGGYSGYFADPDRFPWTVARNPSFAMMEDGSIRVPD
jgi:catechol 2,3-dioxygenase-like lactoylglutathione lyase family enzyme